jgi:glycosyltransferase involved in cell wall biosynthesis
MVRHVLMTADAIGGVWTYALALAGQLARAGVRTTLATMGELPRPEQRAAATAIPGLELRESTHRLEWMEDPWNDVEAAGDWLLGLEADVRPDVVHLNGYAHGLLPWSAPHLVVAHSCVVSWWHAVHGCAPPDTYTRYRDAVGGGLARARAVVAPTRWMLESLATHYGPGATAGRGLTVPNGADVARRGGAVRKEAFVFAAGRVWDRAKNVEALAAVAPRLSVPVVVAGAAAAPGGDELATGAVRGIGWIDHAATLALMDRAAVFAAPARYEPFGLGILEAALRGCALVLGDVPSLREVWGDAALFVAPDDHEALASALRRLMERPLERARLAAAACTRAQTYSVETMARRYLAIYHAMEAAGAARAVEGACA